MSVFAREKSKKTIKRNEIKHKKNLYELNNCIIGVFFFRFSMEGKTIGRIEVRGFRQQMKLLKLNVEDHWKKEIVGLRRDNCFDGGKFVWHRVP